MQRPSSAERPASFPCPNPKCKGDVFPVAMDGRFYLHRNIYINVPYTFVIPRCNVCQQDWFTPELDDATNQLLEVEFQRHAAIIGKIVSEYQNAQ